MDSVTHTILGVCLGEAIAGKQLGRKAWVLGALASNFPDLDVVSKLWLTESEVLLAHRGLTHSFLFVGICVLGFSFLFKKIFSAKEVSLKRWLLFFGSALGSHIFLDAFTAYGTGWYEPFNHSRVSFNSLFIVDPLFALPFLIGTIAVLSIRSNPQRRLKWAKRSLLAGAIYLCLIVIDTLYVNKMIRKNLHEQQIPSADFIATPTPFNSLLWYVVVKDDSRYHFAYYSLFDGDEPIAFWERNRGDSLLTEACYSEDLQNFLDFTKGYYCVSASGDTIVVSDLKFGQQGGWEGNPAPFVFNFYIEGNKGYCSNLQHGRFEFFNFGSFKDLVKRIGGRKGISRE